MKEENVEDGVPPWRGRREPATMDPMPKEEADEARETRSRGCIPRWRKCGIADGWGLNTRISGGILLNTVDVKRRIFTKSHYRPRNLNYCYALSVQGCRSASPSWRGCDSRDATVAKSWRARSVSGASELELIRQGKS